MSVCWLCEILSPLCLWGNWKWKEFISFFFFEKEGVYKLRKRKWIIKI